MSEVSYKALGDAVERLGEALALFEAHRTDELAESMRNSVLKAFMFTYSLCRPMMERFLLSDGADPAEVEDMSLSTIVRSCNEKGVLRADWTVWRQFREARNRMSHVYSRSFAKEIVALIPDFLKEVQYLYQQLATREVEG